MANQTTQDAHERILNARRGSFINASLEYLDALKEELVKYLQKTNDEITIHPDNVARVIQQH